MLDAAWQAVHTAGEIIGANWRQPKIIVHKGAVDLVTDTDRRCERIIVEILAKSFPDHSFLAEAETRLEQRDSAYRWIVDPFDGTTNFAHGYRRFCVSIGLELQGAIIVGWVYDPLRQECFRAVKGKGATLNGVPIHCSQVDNLDDALLATGFRCDRRDHADFYLSFFRGFMTRCQEIRRNGSAALDLGYVARGRLDGYWELKLKPWDVAAGGLIVSEAGGKLSDLGGQRFDIRGQETLAIKRRV